jgi:hypothetical protein
MILRDRQVSSGVLVEARGRTLGLTELRVLLRMEMADLGNVFFSLSYLPVIGIVPWRGDIGSGILAVFSRTHEGRSKGLTPTTKDTKRYHEKHDR